MIKQAWFTVYHSSPELTDLLFFQLCPLWKNKVNFQVFKILFQFF